MTPNDSSIEFDQKLNIFINQLTAKARAKFDYNLKSNVPAKILKIEDCAENALNHGIVSAFNELHGWDCGESIQMAYDLMEDSNAHEECRALAKFLSK